MQPWQSHTKTVPLTVEPVLAMLVFLIGFTLPNGTRAQSFTNQKDTITAIVNTDLSISNNVTNITSAPITLKWRIKAHDFPASWSGPANIAICDNQFCRANTSNQLLNGTSFTSGLYQPSQPGTFYLQLDLTAAEYGSHSLVVTLSDSNFSRDLVFNIKHLPPSGLADSEGGLFTLAPNPSSGIVNIKLSSALTDYHITLVDPVGQVIDHEPAVLRKDDHLELDLTTYQGNVYIIALEAGHTRLLKRVILVK